MKLKCDIAKTIIGGVSIGFILYFSLEMNLENSIRCLMILFGIILMFVVINSVSFIKGQEAVWLLMISVISLMPFNIKLTKSLIYLLIPEYPILSQIFTCAALLLSIISAEEILLGIVGRIIWSRQKDSFLDEII